MLIVVQVSNNNNNRTDSRKGHQIHPFLLLLNFLLIVYLGKGPCFSKYNFNKKAFNFKQKRVLYANNKMVSLSCVVLITTSAATSIATITTAC